MADLVNLIKGDSAKAEQAGLGFFGSGFQDPTPQAGSGAPTAATTPPLGFGSPTPTTQTPGAGFLPPIAPAPADLQPGFTSEQLQQLTQAGITNTNDPRAEGFSFAADGGTFVTPGEPVLVGEAGKPEIVEALPGGGFKVTPIKSGAAHGGTFALQPEKNERLAELDQNAADAGFDQHNLDALAQSLGLTPGSAAYKQFINEVQAGIASVQTIQGFPVQQPGSPTGTGSAGAPNTIGRQIQQIAADQGLVREANFGGAFQFAPLTTGTPGGGLSVRRLNGLDIGGLLSRFSNDAPSFGAPSATTSGTAQPPGSALSFGSNGPVSQQEIVDLERSVRPPAVDDVIQGRRVRPSQPNRTGFFPQGIPTFRNLSRLTAGETEALGTSLATDARNPSLVELERDVIDRFNPGGARRQAATRRGF